MKDPRSHHQQAFGLLKDSLNVAVADSFRMNCASTLENQLNNFVSGIHAAVFDGALVVGAEELPDDPDDRMPLLLKQYSNHKVVLGLCMKVITPEPHPKEKGRFSYSFTLAEAQKQCTAFIFQNVTKPEYVALVPRYYLSKMCSVRDGRTYAKSDGYSLEGNPEPLPVEWSPFVMPTSKLKQGLEVLTSFCTESDAKWINPHNEVELRGCPKPDLYPPGLLLPTHAGALARYMLSETFRVAFSSHSTRYKVLRTLGPRDAYDFGLHHCESDMKSAIKLEQSSCRIDSDGRLQYFTTPGLASTEGPATAIISPCSIFDILLTNIVGTSPPQYLLITRDELPDEWFSPNATIMTNQGCESTWWKPDEESFLQSRTFSWISGDVNENDNIASVRSIEAILDILVTTSTFISKKKRYTEHNATLEQRIAQLMKDNTNL